MKPGIKTSEMVITLIGVCGGILLASGVFGDSQWTTIVGGLLAAICGGSYTVGRSMVKGKEAIGAAQVEAARHLAKKD